MSLIIKNGTIVTSSNIFIGDIYIEGEKIKEIGSKLDIKKAEVIDAIGKYIIPGGIDAHTHFNLHTGSFTASDDFYTGTVAAAFGGTTTIIDHMGFGPKGCSLKHQVGVYHEYADNMAVIDYGFHGVFQWVNDDILAEIEDMMGLGITSLKIYLTYDFRLEDDEIYRVFKKMKELKALPAVHSENHEIITYLRDYYSKSGLRSPIYHAKSRPPECEAEAISRMINIASLAESPLYIVHLSTKKGLKYIKLAKDEGQKVYAETCPQYLVLDESKYLNEGAKYIMSPPLRKKEDNEALWIGLKDGTISTVATDHCPFYYEIEKKPAENDFTKCPNGAPGVEERIPIMFSEGVMKGRISLNKFVEVTSTNPAKLFGIYPKKGEIANGSDADL
ncbi:MAG: dihydropyrimidinase, partial [Clostridiaceae bacterium]